MTEGLNVTQAAALKADILSSLRCALPGRVEAFDAARGTADILPADSRLPLLRSVPVFRPEVGNTAPGDLCLVILADFDTEAFLETGEAGQPASGRRHSLSDAFAFVGFGARGEA